MSQSVGQNSSRYIWLLRSSPHEAGQLDGALFWTPWGRMGFQAYSGIGRTQYLEVVGLKSLFPGLLLPRGCSEFLASTSCHSLAWDSSLLTFKANDDRLRPSHAFDVFWLFFYHRSLSLLVFFSAVKGFEITWGWFNNSGWSPGFQRDCLAALITWTKPLLVGEVLYSQAYY